MKALVKTKKGEGNLALCDVPIPQIPQDDWVLIRVMAAGVCGTDLHIWHDQFPYWPPVVIGHEFSGQVVKTGTAVKNVKAGDRVVAEPHSLACGECYLCRQGKIQLCEQKRSPGWGIDGGFAEYVTMPARLLHQIPAGMSYEIAALAEPMAIAVHQVAERCKIGCQDFVVVSGAGPIGILAAFVAKENGAGTVLETGINACELVRFPVAKLLGADRIVNVEKEDALGIVMEMTKGRGADIVIETSGAANAVGQSVKMLKKCGKLCAIGMPNVESIPVPWREAVLKSLDTVFCMSSSYPAWDAALSLMAHTEKDLSAVITHKTPLEEWETVFHDLEAERGIKAVFLPQR